MPNIQDSPIEEGSLLPGFEETSFYNNLARLHSSSQPRTDARPEQITYDATTFIAVVSELELDNFPLTWHSGMGELGRGKTAQVQQSVVNLETQFAFKRFTFPGSEEPNESQIIRSAIIEAIALSHPALQSHRNILNLHGVCWDISTTNNLFRPALVVEKSSLGDLGHFMSENGSAVDGENRVELCADIINAVATLHVNGIIHGDIKPQNFLVFQEETGEYYLKLADFGFSTLTSIENEDTKLDIPTSWPWSAPELSCQQHGLSIPAAKATDVYSVGLVCWWLILGEKELDVPQASWNGSYESISQLKQSNELMAYARSRMEGLEDIDQEMKSSLLKFFQWTTMETSDKRIPHLIKFIDDVPTPVEYQPFEYSPLLSIRKAFGSLMCSSITLRKHIVHCLQVQLMDGSCTVHRPNAAFQLAVCCYIGFAAPEEDSNVTKWLEIAGKTLDNLHIEIELIRTRDTSHELEYRNKSLQILAGDGFFYGQIHSNQDRSDAHEAELSLSRELKKMQQVLIPGDYVIIRLQRELSTTIETQGYFNRARSILGELLQFMENDQDYGPSHPRTLVVAGQVLNLLRLEGEYSKGIELGEQKLCICQEILGDHDLRTASFQIQLAQTLELKERYRSSENLYRQGLETQSNLLGKLHPTTISTMHDIGSMFTSLLRYQEALEIMTEVVENAVKVLGMEHPNTLNAIGSLASILLGSNAFWQAEKLFRMEAAGIRDHWGEDHSSLPKIMSNLAMAIAAQDRFDEAEEIIREASAKATRLFGDDHCDALTTRSNLAFILSGQEKYADAEAILRELAPKQEAQLGKFHSKTLISKIRLALTVRNQGRLEETKSLQLEILNSSNDSTTTSKDHSFHLLKLRIHLGRTLQLMGANEAAIQEIRTALDEEAATLERDHSDAFAKLTMLSSWLQQDGFLQEAEEYHTAAAAKCGATLGESHTETLTATYWLATYWMLVGRFSEADALLQRVCTGIEEAKGKHHWSAQRAHLLLEYWRSYSKEQQGEADE